MGSVRARAFKVTEKRCRVLAGVLRWHGGRPVAAAETYSERVREVRTFQDIRSSGTTLSMAATLKNETGDRVVSVTRNEMLGSESTR